MLQYKMKGVGLVNIQYVAEQFDKILQKGEIKYDEPMRKHTSFRIGGPADFFIRPGDIEELKQVIQCCKKESVPYYIIGNGSNLLVKDKGFRGCIIQIYDNFKEVHIDGTKVTAQSGVLLSRLSNVILAESLTGFEFAHGIPGTLGGAVFMNAGAYGGEMKDVIQYATVMDLEGNIFQLANEELELGYRTSIAQKKGYIVLEVVMQLQKGEYDAIKKRVNELTHQRTTKQPLNMPSAGSTFKRPPGYFAGKLIMDAGLRGYRIGGAQVSEKHCGFVVNTGDATAKDVLDLIAYVQKKVKEQFEVQMETEVLIIGEE